MKKINIALSALLLGLAVCSCQKELDIPQKSVLTIDSYYENAGPEEAEALIAAVYKNFYSGVNGIEKIVYLDVLSDDHLPGGGGFSDAANHFQDTGNLLATSTHESPRVMYQSIYKVMYYCNLILERIPETNDATINRVKAEANFMRALCMFEAVRWWGTPPFVTSTVSKEDYDMPNGDTEEIIKWVLDQMKDAADKLPELKSKGGQRSFGARVSKQAALAYRGKVGLWYGQKYSKKEYVTAAVADLNSVIKSAVYGLQKDMYAIARVAGNFSEENVFEYNGGDNGVSGTQLVDIRQTWMSLRNDDMSIPATMSGGWGWDVPSGEFGKFLEQHEGGIDKPRFKSTIMTYDQIVEESGGEVRNPIAYCEGYFRVRSVNYIADKYQIQHFWTYNRANQVYLRYAEVLLLYAEAKLIADNDADGSGLAALNEVRRRAELEDAPVLDWKTLKDERRAELWNEQERYFDLVRWGDASTVLKDKGKSLSLFKGYKSGSKEWDIELRQGPGSGWDDKYQLLPFPYQQLSSNSLLEQNKGW